MFRACVLLALAATASARDAKLLRYPHYHQGRVTFSFLGDIWAANENGSGLQRLTANAAYDIYPRFSPDGKWIAFSSDRAGNLDVYIVAAEGGIPKQLTFHSAADNVLGWTPDSRAVLFSSQRGEDFMAKLYTVTLDGGMERSTGADMGLWASFSPDGKKLAINRRSQVYWRKYYHGSFQSDVTVMDVAAKTFTDVTDYDGMDSWPMWSTDGFIYFVSDREGKGLTNIWRTKPGGKAERVTAFTTGDVRWPAMSADGKTIVFEHDFGVWKLDAASRKTTALKFDIAAETQENLTEVRSYTSRVDDYDLSPNGKRIALSIHGEVFTAPVDEGDLRQITDNPARDRDVSWSPDGKRMAFISDRSGREEIFVAAADGSGDAEKLTDLDVLKNGLRWSPDSKELVFTTSDYRLIKVNLAAKQTLLLASSKFGSIGAPDWSPDGKWIAFSMADHTRSTDIYLVPSAGGEAKKATFDSYSEVFPRFSADGKKLYFLRLEGQGSNVAFPMANLYVIGLERQEKDPDDPEERADAPETPADGPRRPAGPRKIEDVKLDFDGLKRRTTQVTRMPYSVGSYAPAPDSKSVAFTVREPMGTRTVPVLYTIQDDGKRLTRVTTGGGGGEEEAGGGGRGGFGGGISNLAYTRDGRTLFFQEGGGVFSINVPQGAGGGAGPGAGGGAAARKRVNFTAKVTVNKSAEWAEMFGDAWRTMKYRFYDPKMHGMDWDGARAKYQPLVEFVGNRQEVLNIVNEMIGELNASHTGAAPPPNEAARGVQTGHLGVELTADEAAGRYRVTYVYETGPADHDWVKVKVGDYLLAIDGKPVAAGDNYWKLLNNRLNKKVTLTLNAKPSEEGAWKTRVEPSSMTAYNQLRYERWVKDRQAMTEKLSAGKIGYVHIQAMNGPSLKKFEKELRENRDKKALIIDQRWNGGGNIEQELLALLVQRQYQVWQPRGTESTGRPFAGFFGPKVVLQNWRSASNAEMFPAGFRALGLGKTVGTQTMGAVIGTGSYSLVDGSTVRTPQVGVYLADQKSTNMENFGVKPDIEVENTPEDNLKGRDRQLEVAVETLLKQIQ